MLFLLVLGAMLMSVAISSLGLPRQIVLSIGKLPLSPLNIVLILFFMYLVMGCFIDGISMLLATMPFVVPIISTLGVDFIWFGVALILIVEIGQVTPPVGLNLFVVRGIGGPDTALSDIFLGTLPFVMLNIFVLVLITVFPEITHFLPRILGLL
jgi:TRAP-type C4-dicarboxylate transport system permease large subunit